MYKGVKYMSDKSRTSECKVGSRLFSKIALLSASCMSTLALSPAVSHAQPTTIAHWSFDTPTLTVSGGNITVVDDVVGAHDASVSPTGVRNAAASAPFVVATDSVAGQFGQALRFNGNNYLVYPDLTELMQSNGAPSYSVSMWLKWLSTDAPVGNSVYRTMSNWGNAAPGIAGTNSSHVYGFGPQGPATIRGQTRREDDPDGSDIYARNANATVPGGQWHMLTWTFNTTSGVLSTYFDAALIDTFTSTAPSFQLADGLANFGTFGLKADDATFQFANNQMDEVWVFNSILTPTDVETLFLQNGFGPPPRPGDVDLDTDVDMADFELIRANFRNTVSTRAQGDLVRNNVVDFDDFRQWKTAFLSMGGSLAGVDLSFESVPEPSSALLLLVAAGAFATTRRRR
jgi:Concanavalin A-like lectin/glucanases superfamily/PEP-CTERM motif